jgi:hypothetical protein
MLTLKRCNEGQTSSEMILFSSLQDYNPSIPCCFPHLMSCLLCSIESKKHGRMDSLHDIMHAEMSQLEVRSASEEHGVHGY